MRLSYKLLNDPAVVKTELLSTRVCDLQLKLSGTMLQRCIDRAITEVQDFGVELRPYFYLSDAYGCVQNTANIGLGFWDVSEPLREIYRDARAMNRDEVDLILLLKHEIGHAFCYGHKLYQLPDFRRMFSIRGRFYATYPDHNQFPVDPYSVDHVNPDFDHYAQKHPDDDFAETFATYIDPDAAWRERYHARSGALKKIAFVAKLIATYGQATPTVEPGSGLLDLPVERIHKTVAQFFRIGRTRYLRAADGYIDDELRRIFHNRGRRQHVEPASELLRRYRKFIETSICARVRPRDSRAVTDLLDKTRNRLKALQLVYDVDEQDKALAELYGLLLHKSFVFNRFGTFRNGQ